MSVENRKLRATAPSFPPPSTPLPSLPPQTPPSTPRNASHLYGEFSWPSLDLATLLDRLEDVAEGEQQQDHFVDFSEILVACYGEEDDSTSNQQAVFSEILSLLDGTVPKRDSKIYKWLEGVYEGSEGDNDSLYFTASEAGDSESESESEYTDAKTGPDCDNIINSIDENEWVDDLDRAEMGKLLGWFEGFEGETQEQMLEVNARTGRARRSGTNAHPHIMKTPTLPLIATFAAIILPLTSAWSLTWYDSTSTDCTSDNYLSYYGNGESECIEVGTPSQGYDDTTCDWKTNGGVNSENCTRGMWPLGKSYIGDKDTNCAIYYGVSGMGGAFEYPGDENRADDDYEPANACTNIANYVGQAPGNECKKPKEIPEGMVPYFVCGDK
ncbi:MAG: hypothetical protein Q9209_006418 [Squamulea sp. 1 TL-2023]